MKLTRPWTGKKNNLPDDSKKQQHKDRKIKKVRLNELKDKEWEDQIKEFECGKIDSN